MGVTVLGITSIACDCDGLDPWTGVEHEKLFPWRHLARCGKTPPGRLAPHRNADDVVKNTNEDVIADGTARGVDTGLAWLPK